jgi:hypothetical protein
MTRIGAGVGKAPRRAARLAVRLAAVQLALLALPGCEGIDTALETVTERARGTAPVVRGDSGGAAAMTLIACPKSQAQIEAAQVVMNEMVQYGSEMVVARNGGSARLTINSCPPPLTGTETTVTIPQRKGH